MAPDDSEGIEDLLGDSSGGSSQTPLSRTATLEQTLETYELGKSMLDRLKRGSWDIPPRLVYHSGSPTNPLKEHFRNFAKECIEAIRIYPRSQGAYKAYLEARALLRDLSDNDAAYKEFNKTKADIIKGCLVNRAASFEARIIEGTLNLIYGSDSEISRMLPSFDRAGLLQLRENLKGHFSLMEQEKTPEALKRLGVFVEANYGDFNPTGGGYNHPLTVRQIRVKSSGRPANMIVLTMLPREVGLITLDGRIYTAGIVGNAGYNGGNEFSIAAYHSLSQRVIKAGSLEEARGYMAMHRVNNL